MTVEWPTFLEAGLFIEPNRGLVKIKLFIELFLFFLHTFIFIEHAHLLNNSYKDELAIIKLKFLYKL